jgi:hypothetical protein
MKKTTLLFIVLFCTSVFLNAQVLYQENFDGKTELPSNFSNLQDPTVGTITVLDNLKMITVSTMWTTGPGLKMDFPEGITGNHKFAFDGSYNKHQAGFTISFYSPEDKVIAQGLIFANASHGFFVMNEKVDPSLRDPLIAADGSWASISGSTALTMVGGTAKDPFFRYTFNFDFDEEKYDVKVMNVATSAVTELTGRTFLEAGSNSIAYVKLYAIQGNPTTYTLDNIMIYKGELTSGILQSSSDKFIIPTSICKSANPVLMPYSLQTYKLNLRDMSGRIIGTSHNKGLNISELNNGLYLWSVVTADGETFSGKTLIR